MINHLAAVVVGVSGISYDAAYWQLVRSPT